MWKVAGNSERENGRRMAGYAEKWSNHLHHSCYGQIHLYFVIDDIGKYQETGKWQEVARTVWSGRELHKIVSC